MFFHARIGPLCLFAAATTLFCLTGCGDKPTATVSGTVSYKGTPLNAGTIKFVGEAGASVSAAIEPDGKYSVSKVPIGSVKIAIHTPPPVSEKQAGKVPGSDAGGPKPVQIPKEYSDTATSGLSYTVKPGNQDYPIELK